MLSGTSVHKEWMVVLLGGLLLAGCGSSRVPSSSPSLGDRISSIFGNKPAQQPVAEGTPPPAISAEDIECPTVTIRPGTSTYSVNAAGDVSAMSLRYQATFSQFARECKIAGPTLTIRVGVEGRIILGPAGGPGQIELPIRYAVVAEGPEPKTIITKVRWLQVPIPPGESNIPFSQIEDELSFPTPRGQELDSYIVYVGFDSSAPKQPEKKKAPPPKKPRRPA